MMQRRPLFQVILDMLGHNQESLGTLHVLGMRRKTSHHGELGVTGSATHSIFPLPKCSAFEFARLETTPSDFPVRSLTFFENLR